MSNTANSPITPGASTTRSTEPSKAKLALCIDTPDSIRDVTGLSLQPIEDVFYELPTRLVDRAICEQDEDTLQLIPYIVVLDQSGKVLHYSRGKAGAEDRLKANTSIGLGGHVDLAPTNENLYGLLQEEAKRELQEEIGLTVHREIRFSHLIIDRTNPVGRVHLALLAVYQLDADDEIDMGAEIDQITDPEWVTLRTLQQPERYAKLENWSQLALDYVSAVQSLK